VNQPAQKSEIHHLKLDDALALLAQDTTRPLPQRSGSKAAYLQELIDRLCELSLKDPLTGIFNRRHLNSVLGRTIDMVARSGEPALLLMIDIDHFKKINDTYGHHSGDVVLQSVAKTLGKCVRPMDTVARFGGEEFSVVLPSCHTFFGRDVAERIRQAIQETPIALGDGNEIRITASIGGAYAPEWLRSSPAAWTERADVQLYKAKAEGRNRVFLDTQKEISVSADEKNMIFRDFVDTTNDLADFGNHSPIQPLHGKFRG
jgi:two-component system cell cycle response regulator